MSLVSHQISTNAVLEGTSSYIAPEYLLDEQKLVQYSDIWSLGITLLEFLTYENVWNMVLDNIHADSRLKSRLKVCSFTNLRTLFSAAVISLHLLGLKHFVGFADYSKNLLIPSESVGHDDSKIFFFYQHGPELYFQDSHQILLGYTFYYC